MVFLTVCHVMTCMWIITAKFKIETLDGTSWDDPYIGIYMDDAGDADGGMYVTSLYFIITTMTTVGYGDISG